MKRLLLFTAIMCLGLQLMPAVLFAQTNCVNGTISAELQASGPNEGLWKYTLEVSWDTPSGLSHVTLNCQFGCDAVCDADWRFDTPAGESDGEPEPCTVPYQGEFNCNGDPSIGLTEPVVKWDALGNASCEPAKTGTATLCFYVDAPPNSGSTPIVLIKNGQNVCEGVIDGDCPACPVAVEALSWSAVKWMFF